MTRPPSHLLLRHALPRPAVLVCTALALGLGLAGPAAAQTQESPTAGLQLTTQPASSPLRAFLNRGVWPGYWNFGKSGYTPLTNSVRSTELYDRLGTHLFRGYPLVSWRETRSDSVGLQESQVVRENYFFNFFNNLMLASDSYRGWNLAVTAGDAIRTSLSPLTVRNPRWQGLRLDGGNGRQGFTALLTRGAAQRFSAFDARRDLSPVLGYGGHYDYEPSRLLTLGLTLFNQHQVDVESKAGSFVSGTQPYQIQAPRQVSLWVQSDDPAAIAGVRDVDVELVLVDTDGTRRRLTSDAAAAAAAGVGGSLTYDPSLEPGPPAGVGAPVNGVYRVTGGQVAEYLFDLPVGARLVSARFHADVSGDYRISVRQAHDYVDAKGAVQRRFWPSTYVNAPGHNQTGNPQYPFDFKPQESAPHATVARASGSPGLGRQRRVSFDYGIPSGKTLLGTDFRVAARELMAEGEIVYSSDESHFPFSNDSLGVRGRRLTAGSWAYLLNARRPFAAAGLDMEVGGELFAMDPEYSGGYDNRRGGTVFFTDKGGASGSEAFTQEFALMDDNDDDDEYSDDTFSDQGRFQQYVPSGNYSGGPTGGVFPGLDEDGDLSPDNDRDRNGVPDWTEPFLLFGSDPADFVYGIDFNNNGQPDFRENDDHPDYPIRKDQRGRHAFLTAHDLLPGVERTSVGYYGMEEIAGAGRATSVYERLEGRWQPFGSFDVRLLQDAKIVEDDVRDDVYEWVLGDTSRLANVYTVLNPPPADSLPMRRSLANTAFVELSYSPRPSLRLTTGILHHLNRQRRLEEDGVLVQDGDTFAELSVVSRAEYRYLWKKVEVWTAVKHALKEGRRGASQGDGSTRFFAPIVRASYEIMEGIDLQWGMSGLPGLPMAFTDNQVEALSYDERKMAFMLIGRTDNFEGSYVSVSTGLELHRKDYHQVGRERDFDTYGVFVDIIVGN